jgi:hypothetical protein
MEGEETEGDVSPRTLAAAVARLAAYTSAEPVGESLGRAFEEGGAGWQGCRYWARC